MSAIRKRNSTANSSIVSGGRELDCIYDVTYTAPTDTYRQDLERAQLQPHIKKAILNYRRQTTTLSARQPRNNTTNFNSASDTPSVRSTMSSRSAISRARADLFDVKGINRYKYFHLPLVSSEIPQQEPVTLMHVQTVDASTPSNIDKIKSPKDGRPSAPATAVIGGPAAETESTGSSGYTSLKSSMSSQKSATGTRPRRRLLRHRSRTPPQLNDTVGDDAHSHQHNGTAAQCTRCWRHASPQHAVDTMLRSGSLPQIVPSVPKLVSKTVVTRRSRSSQRSSVDDEIKSKKTMIENGKMYPPPATNASDGSGSMSKQSFSLNLSHREGKARDTAQLIAKYDTIRQELDKKLDMLKTKHRLNMRNMRAQQRRSPAPKQSPVSCEKIVAVKKDVAAEVTLAPPVKNVVDASIQTDEKDAESSLKRDQEVQAGSGQMTSSTEIQTAADVEIPVEPLYTLDTLPEAKRSLCQQDTGNTTTESITTVIENTQKPMPSLSTFETGETTSQSTGRRSRAEVEHTAQHSITPGSIKTDLSQLVELQLQQSIEQYATLRANELLAQEVQLRARIWGDVREYVNGQLLPDAIAIAVTNGLDPEKPPGNE